MYTITSLHVYPIKGMKGVNLPEAELSTTGVKYDRHWMLIDENNRAVTQRELPQLALCEVSIYAAYIGVEYKGKHVLVPKVGESSEVVDCYMFDNEMKGIVEAEEICAWFSEQFDRPLRLVRPSVEHPREVSRHEEYAIHFSDGHQYLVLGEESMTMLNNKLDASLDIDRFRANIIFSGGEAHDEDGWSQIAIGDHVFEFTKPCSRCKVTTIDQTTAEMSLEPLKTLATYRKENRKINFGAYYKLTSASEGRIRVGDQIQCV